MGFFERHTPQQDVTASLNGGVRIPTNAAYEPKLLYGTERNSSASREVITPELAHQIAVATLYAIEQGGVVIHSH